MPAAEFAALLLVWSRARFRPQLLEPLRTHFVHDATKLLNLLAKPFELFLGDAVVFRVARFDVSFPELLEPRAIPLQLARPHVGQAGIDALGLRKDTLILFYSDNGTDRRITSRFSRKTIRGGKNQVTQNGIRVPLIANWPGQITPGTNSALIDASDFLPTLAALAGKKLPEDWHTDGVSFAPRLFGKAGTPREWAFFWYDPRPGWDKDKFSRHIFALDHHYKLFSDGRFFDIAGSGFQEVPLNLSSLSKEAQAAREKLQAAIQRCMLPPLSVAAKVEVDAYGKPVQK